MGSHILRMTYLISGGAKVCVHSSSIPELFTCIFWGRSGWKELTKESIPKMTDFFPMKLMKRRLHKESKPCLEEKLQQINFHLPRQALSHAVFFFLHLVEAHPPLRITLLDSGRLHAGLDWASVKENLLQFWRWLLNEMAALHFLNRS